MSRHLALLFAVVAGTALPAAAQQAPADLVVTNGRIYTADAARDVVDAMALAKAHPDLVTITPKRADILALIRAGTREIPGLTIRKEVKVGVRA